MDINEIFEDGEDLQEQNKPSLEEIKKIVDSKRLKGSKARTPENQKKMKSLDLTITDDDIKNNIENNSNTNNYNTNNITNNKKTIEPKIDEKLKSFLDALLKK